MNEPRPQFLVVGRGEEARRIAYLTERGGNPGLLWLPGFKSDMISTKAAALAAWAKQHDCAYTRFDYSGHGQSDGRFEDGTIGRWLEEVIAVFCQLTRGPQIIIGSSMGGYVALLALRQLLSELPDEARRIHSLILIAPAWDMTEELMWKRFPDDVRQTIREDGVWLRPSRYGDDPYAITRGLIDDGRNHLIGQQPWDPGRPIHIIHGRLDPDVPFAHSELLVAMLRGSSVELTEVPDGEHRLSRPEDLERLYRAIEAAASAQR